VNTRTLPFDDVIKILKAAEGTLCGISVAPEVTRIEWSNVLHFEGIMGQVDEHRTDGDVLIEILSSQGVRSGWSYPAVGAGWIQLSRTRFRATLEDDPGDEPQTLAIWQRGIRLHLKLWPPGTVRLAAPDEALNDAGEDDAPF